MYIHSAYSVCSLVIIVYYTVIDPATNLVMRVLKENSNPKMFSEKLMLLVNRGGMLLIRGY